MKTKLIFSALLLAAFAFSAQAQVKPKCESDFVTFENNSKQGDLEDTSGLLPTLIEKCPRYNEKIYVYGEAILKNKIELSRTAGDKQGAIDRLLELYAAYDKNFPANTFGAANKKALLLRDNKLASDDEVFKMLDASFKKDSKTFTSYEPIDAYYTLYLKEYEAGKGITPEQFIERYSAVSGQVATAINDITTKKCQLEQKLETQQLTDEEKYFLSKADGNVKNLNAVSDNISRLSSKYFSCEKLDAFYEKDYEANKANTVWLTTMVSVMTGNKCYASAVLQKGALALHTLRLTVETSYTLGTLNAKNRKFKEAVPYFDQAAAMETNTEKKSILYYETAVLLRNSDKAQAKKYALQAANANSKYGRPYIFLAELYSSVSAKECDLSSFERKALYWLAIENSNKAAAAEPQYKATAAAMVKKYDTLKPNKADAKAAGKKKGETITFGCWISESVVIPAL